MVGKITELAWPGVEEGCRRKRNDHADENVIVQPNGKIMLHSGLEWLLIVTAIPYALADTPHGTTPIDGLRRPTFFLPAYKLRKLPKWSCKHPTALDLPAVIMLPEVA